MHHNLPFVRTWRKHADICMQCAYSFNQARQSTNTKKGYKMANKMYQVKTENNEIRYATGRTKLEAFKNYMNAHINSVVLSIELLTY